MTHAAEDRRIPEWLRDPAWPPAPREQDAWEYVAQLAIRRAVTAHILPVWEARSPDELDAHLQEAPRATRSKSASPRFLDALRFVHATILDSARTVEVVAATDPNATTLAQFLLPRVLAVLAYLSAHRAAASVPDASAPVYPLPLVRRLSEAVELLRQLVGTALYVCLDTSTLVSSVRYTLYDAVQRAVALLSTTSSTFQESDLRFPATYAYGQVQDTFVLAAPGDEVPEAYAPRSDAARTEPPAGVAPYEWSPADDAALSLSLAQLPTPFVASLSQTLLFLSLELVSGLADVFPTTVQDLIELASRALLVQWTGDLLQGSSALLPTHMAPYVLRMRYDAALAALPRLEEGVSAVQLARLAVESFTAMYYPAHGAVLDVHTAPETGAADFVEAGERLAQVLRLVQERVALGAAPADVVSIVGDLPSLAPTLLQGALSREPLESGADLGGTTSDQLSVRLQRAFRRCSLYALLLVLGVHRDAAAWSAEDHQLLAEFAQETRVARAPSASWMSADESQALLAAIGPLLAARPSLPEASPSPTPKRRKRAADAASLRSGPEANGAALPTTPPLPLPQALEGVQTRSGDAAAEARAYVALARAMHTAEAEALAALSPEAVCGACTPGVRHADRGVRLAAGDALVTFVLRGAELPRAQRPADWEQALLACAGEVCAPVTRGNGTCSARVQETCVVMLGRLGACRQDEVAGRAITVLLQAFALPHVYLRSLAHVELVELAARLQCTTFQMLHPYLDAVSKAAVDMMHGAPAAFAEVAHVLRMSPPTFLTATLNYTLPQLIEERTAGHHAEAMGKLRAIAQAVGQSVPGMCLAHISAIFQHFFLCDEQTRDAALELLPELLGSEAVSLQSLLRSRLHEVLGHLVVRLGSAAQKERALGGLAYVHELIGTGGARRRERGLAEFLREQVLAILTWINEELASYHGKLSMSHKAMTARSIGELVKLIGAVVQYVAPQVMASLSSTLQEPALTLPTLESWLDFVQSLRYHDVGPFVGPTAAALLAVWPRLDAPEKACAKAILHYTIVENAQELHTFIDDVPSLDALEEDVPEVARHLRASRRVWADEDHFRHILERVAHENAAICLQSLRELRTFLQERRSVVETWTSGNLFHPLVAQCVRVLFAVAARTEQAEAAVPELCLECVGMLGAVDPDRFEVPAEETLFVLLSNFENGEETAAFALRTLRDVLVPAFRATGDPAHQATLAYAIQELLKLCEFTPALMDTGGRSVADRVRRRWEELPEGMLPTLTPLLNSRYMVRVADAPMRQTPVYQHATSFRDWMRAWTLRLMHGAAPGDAARVFGVFRAAVSENDIGLAQYLLPHLVLHTLIAGSEEQRGEVLNEFVCVLTDQVDPQSGYAPERRLLTAQTMFALMDHVGHWMRRVRLVQARSSKRARLKESLGEVQAVIDNISQELMAQASLRCNAYARSLLNFEYRVRDLRQHRGRGEAELQPYYEVMHKVYACLDDPDGMEGISTKVFSPSLEHQIREHESTGRWTDAQSCWEVELQQRPDDVHLHLGLLRCLRNLGHYDTLRTHVRGVLSMHPDWHAHLAPLQTEGACILADWRSVRRLVAQARASAPEVALARVLLAMQDKDASRVYEALRDARFRLGRPLLGLGRASYTHVYDAVTRLHMLHELEMIWQASLEPERAAAAAALDRSLVARYEATLPSFRTREPVLSLRRSAFLACSGHAPARHEIGQCWVLTAKAARRAGHLQTAYSAVLQALHFRAPFAFVQKAKLLAHTDQVQAALQELNHSLQTLEGAAQTDTRAQARANLLRARLVEATARFQQNEIIQHYKACTNLDPDSEKIWYHLGHFYDSPAGGLVGNQMLLQLSVCRFYMKSAQNGTKFLYRTLPRMLTIWLDAGNELVEQVPEPGAQAPAARSEEDMRQTQLQFDKINDMMRKSIRHLARYQWFAVLPQLVARIVHKNEAVWQVLLEIIVAVVVAYPQQSIWALIAGSHSKDHKRRQRYEHIAERVASVAERPYRDVVRVMDAAEQLSTELLHLCEHPVGRESTLSMERHFPLLAAAAQTQELIVPLQSSVNVTLPPNNLVSQHHRPFPGTPPHILGFDDTIEIMHSLQKPRKVVIQASNGARYPFLCKPRDDLRKDARLMEFDSMINKLLQSSSESRRRRLYIRTYAVLILNEECGLIEWVPNTVAFRQILAKHYAALDIPLYTSDLKGILDEARANPKSSAALFEQRVLSRYPPVFHAWFLETFPEPNAWFSARSAYARTAAVMSMVGFVLGLGDRHGDNILFDAGSGDTVHVDLNCLFDKGTTFEVPERVPFRLTHNMVDALGVTGVEGAFRRTAEIALGVLRDNKESLMSVLQAMVHDPLGEWVATERRSRSKPADKHGASAGARRALKSVSDKLDGKLRRPGISEEARQTTRNLVHMLICDATSNQNLSHMYIGWAPYL